MFKKITIVWILAVLLSQIQIKAETVDFALIGKYAEYANIVYSGPIQVKSFLDDHSSHLIQYQTIPETQVNYFLSSEIPSGEQLISVRGTANLENVWVDIEFKLTLDDMVNISLHQGFARSARDVFNDIVPYLKKDRPISITGHSLGGAIAVILAMYLDKASYPVKSVVTFGQPKVTNPGGASKFNHLNVTRVVTPLDLVPLMPPLDPLDIKNPDIFWHLGREVILLEGSKYSVVTGIPSILRAAEFFNRIPDRDNLANHQMRLYLDLINQKTVNPEEIPFKNSNRFLNMFN
ncbi:MAG: lipase family protein [bacterium]